MQNVVGWHFFTRAQLGSEIYKYLVEKLCEPRMTDFFQALIVGVVEPVNSHIAFLRLVFDQCAFHMLNQQIFNKFPG